MKRMRDEKLTGHTYTLSPSHHKLMKILGGGKGSRALRALIDDNYDQLIKQLTKAERKQVETAGE